jgi:hypothetical protein
MMMVPVIGMMTFLLIAAFLLFFMASKTSGMTAAFGRFLGFWLLLFALIGVGGVVTALMNGGKPYGLDMPMMRGEGMRCCQGMRPEPSPAAAPEAPPGQPAPEAPPAQPPANSGG